MQPVQIWMRPKRNLRSIKDNQADQSAKAGVTPYRIHVLPLFNRSVREQLIFKNVCINKMICAMLERAERE
jgi:hypothetical protein